MRNLEIKTFSTSDEQEVAGYAEVMEIQHRVGRGAWYSLPKPSWR